MKNTKENIIRLLVIVLLTTITSTRSFGSDVRVAFGPVCMRLDGVPISTGSPLYTTCCDSSTGMITDAGSQNPLCKGLLYVASNTDGDGATSYNFALQTLQTANTLNSGGSTDFSGSTTPVTSTSAAPAPVTSAITSTGSSDPGASYGTADAAAPASATDSGNGSGGGAAGAGGSAGALGSAGSGNAASANNAGSGSGMDKESARLAYVQGDHASDKAGGNSGGSVMNEGLGESKFSQGNGSDANALASVDDDGTGSPDDPSDYFSRTNKSDNLFKIVTNRYLKKKSLWKVKE